MCGHLPHIIHTEMSSSTTDVQQIRQLGIGLNTLIWFSFWRKIIIEET